MTKMDATLNLLLVNVLVLSQKRISICIKSFPYVHIFTNAIIGRSLCVSVNLGPFLVRLEASYVCLSLFRSILVCLGPSRSINVRHGLSPSQSVSVHFSSFQSISVRLSLSVSIRPVYLGPSPSNKVCISLLRSALLQCIVTENFISTRQVV